MKKILSHIKENKIRYIAGLLIVIGLALILSGPISKMLKKNNSSVQIDTTNTNQPTELKAEMLTPNENGDIVVDEKNEDTEIKTDIHGLEYADLNLENGITVKVAITKTEEGIYVVDKTKRVNKKDVVVALDNKDIIRKAENSSATTRNEEGKLVLDTDNPDVTLKKDLNENDYAEIRVAENDNVKVAVYKENDLTIVDEDKYVAETDKGDIVIDVNKDEEDNYINVTKEDKGNTPTEKPKNDNSSNALPSNETNETDNKEEEITGAEIKVNENGEVVIEIPAKPVETPTPTVSGNTDTPTVTNGTSTPANTESPSNTNTPTSTESPTNTQTPTDTTTPTGTETPGITNTPDNTSTDTPTPTVPHIITDDNGENTPTPTNSPTNSPTNTPTVTVAPTHEHKWEIVTETVDKEKGYYATNEGVALCEVGEKENLSAYETYNVTTEVYTMKCKKCGHTAYDLGIYTISDDAGVTDYILTEEDEEKFLEHYENCTGDKGRGYGYYEQLIDTIKVKSTWVVTDRYKETMVVGYKCSCGATKDSLDN